MIAFALFTANVCAQSGILFDPTFPVKWTPASEWEKVQLPKLLKSQIIFVGGEDSVLYLKRNLTPGGKALSKASNDFIGLTPGANSGEFYLSVNHETSSKNDIVGDGGGMTVFKVTRMANGGFTIDNQNFSDGRSGKLFNVEFEATVGETWNNCGGAVSPDGRIWTAEEYPPSTLPSIIPAFGDAYKVKIGTGIIQKQSFLPNGTGFDGSAIKRFQNIGWMVEVDPKTAKPIRKQYNWGRMSFEGGAILPDNKTIFFGEDGTPGLLTKFVADVAGDFTKGSLYVYKHDKVGSDGRWIKMNNSNLNEMIYLSDSAYKRGATMFVRLEWVVEIGGKIYIAETGKDDAGKDLAKGALRGGIVAPHHNVRANAQSPGRTATDPAYTDYYGRILKYDPATDEVTVFLEGGYSSMPMGITETTKDVPLVKYPYVHLSNPDGLGKTRIKGKDYMIIQEDLNGQTYGRLPMELYGINACEMYLLDMSIPNPTLNDLIRVVIGPKGAELTGGIGIKSNTILLDVQHPSSTVAPYLSGQAVTIAINGFDSIADLKKLDLYLSGDVTKYNVPQVAAPLKYQILFVGGKDEVQITGRDGKPLGKAKSKDGNDFIGFTKDNTAGTTDLGWVTVNLEKQTKDYLIGDGGGMVVFKVKESGDSLKIVDQTLPDGRTGKFFNINFAAHVGESWNNCGGLITADGRIWTAEEYPVSSNSALKAAFSDTSDIVIGVGIPETVLQPFTPAVPPIFKDSIIDRHHNIGWMVEIDPKTGKALRKQYNWGRMSFEGAVIMPDNRTVYCFEDGTPGLLTKFVATTPGNFTQGSLYVYKENAGGSYGNWIKMNNNSLTEMINLADSALKRGASMFVRLEWGVEVGGKVYICETGKDNAGVDLAKGALRGGIAASHHNVRAEAQAPGRKATDDTYYDYYGRILVYDPATDKVTPYLEGGPDFATTKDVPLSSYPDAHLSNPDGLSKIKIYGKDYLIIQEDLNGMTYGRLPQEAYGANLCEMYLLDAFITNPRISDLKRILVAPKGSEITGAVGTPDGKNIFVNIQHPSAATEPYVSGKGVTLALSGFDYQASSANSIISFKFNDFTEPVVGKIEGDQIILKVPATTVVKYLKPTIEISPKAEISPASGELQDFTNPVKYTVTAENGRKKEYTVTVIFEDTKPSAVEDANVMKFKVYPNPANEMISFGGGVYNITIYNTSGVVVGQASKVSQYNVSHLASGLYFVKNNNGEVVKLMIE
mgnify:CR=1 FL=1